MRLRFEEIPDGWERRNLGGVDGLRPACEFLNSKRVPVNSTERAKRKGAYPYYGANGQQGWIDDYIFDEPLVLLAEDGGFFFDEQRMASYRVNGKCWVNNHAHVLRAPPDVLPDWLQLCIGYQDFTHLIPEPNRPKLNQANAKRVVVPVPPLVEQRRLVARIDALVSRLEQAAQSRQAALAEADSLLTIAQRSDYEGLLVTDDAVSLGKIGEVISGGTPAKTVDAYWGGDIPWIAPKEMKRFRIGESSINVTQHAVDAGAAKLVYKPSALMVVRGMILAKRVPIAVSTRPLTINQDMKAFIPSDGLNVSFLGHMLCGAAEELQTRVEVASHGTRKLETPAWSPLPIPVPSAAKQCRIVARLDALAAKQTELRRLQAETDVQLAAFTPALLSKAFRGEL